MGVSASPAAMRTAPMPPSGAPRPAVVMQSFADSVARAAPAVVNIYTARVITERQQAAPLDQLFGEYWPSYRQRVERSLGSGVIVDAKGTIVTNQHVIAGADSIRVQLADGRIAEATVVGQDPDTDLAILHLSIGKLPIMPMGRSSPLRSAMRADGDSREDFSQDSPRQGVSPRASRRLRVLPTTGDYVQTDAAINLGNSGGALIDARGDLVGKWEIPPCSTGTYGGPEGIGFAIPVNLVRGVMEQILAHGHVVRGWLGFVPQDLSPEQARAARHRGGRRGGGEYPGGGPGVRRRRRAGRSHHDARRRCRQELPGPRQQAGRPEARLRSAARRPSRTRCLYAQARRHRAAHAQAGAIARRPADQSIVIPC